MVHNEDAKTTASAADKARGVRCMFVSVSRQPLRRLREHARKYATRIITYGDGDGGRIAGESGANIENEAKVGLVWPQSESSAPSPCLIREGRAGIRALP